eukprot:CAMPEP_0114520874 /NCGR_PEP_ID=MMETSP0109-20121206/19865_1 /TAXON_ID=29199 /ORGANISM="Chlorarachnion reptans, Strain CCCM449" /LENGTH=79 /DNA_ID=CAMNT_0001701901 /DNA_START=601 /DNA_END=840 /DNA_ORIENTATION=+
MRFFPECFSVLGLLIVARSPVRRERASTELGWAIPESRRDPSLQDTGETARATTPHGQQHPRPHPAHGQDGGGGGGGGG